MKPIFFSLCAAALLCGCSIHPKAQLAAVRAAGVHTETVKHLSENSPLTPSDIIDLKRRGVADELAIEHLDRVGLDYELSKDDNDRLKSARVSDRVRDAAMRASSRFANWRSNERYYSGSYDPFFQPYSFGYGYGSRIIVHREIRCRR
jgi:hypothetical protein